MSHSQFHCILFILRHAWLNLWDKHMLLAGSTRFLSFCFRTLTLTHSARPFFVRRTDERTSEEKEQEKHEGFSRFFSSAATCDAANWVLSEYTHTKHPVQLVSTEHNVQTRFVYYLFRSFLASIGALSKRLLAERPKPILHLDVRAAFFLFCYSLWAAGRFGAGPRRRSSDKSHSTFWRSARTFAFTRSSIYLSQLFLRAEKEEREEEEQVVTISSQILIQ